MTEENGILPPRYRQPHRIGHGGMGDIYRARDSLLDRDVAIKVLAERQAEDESTRERFTREALAAARLSSEPGTVTIFDVGEWKGRPFIVMEYLGGGSLEGLLRGEPQPPPARALTWLEQTARALDAAHAQGVVHRDVKPGNLLLDEAGDVHVADFGIASATGMDSLTVAGTILGTAGYLSPEQASGERATAASDRYALAVVAFELLTGRRPFEREAPTAEAAAHANDPVPSVREYAADLPWAELDAVFRRALAKNPRSRYPSCLEFVHDLRAALAGGETTTRVIAPAATEATRVAPAPVPSPPARPGRGPSARVLALVGLLVAALAGGAALAAALADGGGEEGTRTTVSVQTITREGQTVREPVTVTETTETTAPTTATTAPTTTTTPTTESISIEEAVGLNNQAFGLMNQGRWEEALPLAQRALTRLKGSGRIEEAYANYNVGRTLIELDRCEEGLPHIDESERLQGHRSEFDTARAMCD